MFLWLICILGNKRTRIYRYKAIVSDCEKGIKLPCNCDYIEAITTNFEDWNYSTNDTPNGNIHSAYIESYIEHRKEAFEFQAIRYVSKNVS